MCGIFILLYSIIDIKIEPANLILNKLVWLEDTVIIRGGTFYEKDCHGKNQKYCTYST